MDEIIKRFREGNQRAFEELFWGFSLQDASLSSLSKLTILLLTIFFKRCSFISGINDKLSRVKIILRLIFIKH